MLWKKWFLKLKKLSRMLWARIALPVLMFLRKRKGLTKTTRGASRLPEKEGLTALQETGQAIRLFLPTNRRGITVLNDLKGRLLISLLKKESRITGIITTGLKAREGLTTEI